MFTKRKITSMCKCKKQDSEKIFIIIVQIQNDYSDITLQKGLKQLFSRSWRFYIHRKMNNMHMIKVK